MAINRIRLSHSYQDTLHTCERLYQIERLLSGAQSIREAAPLSRGHAFGKGVQVYMLTGDMDKALYHAWLAYWPQIEQRPKVSLHRTLHALMCAQRDLDALREKYEVVDFNGQPAVELGVKLNIDEVFYWSGAIDLVLRNKETGLIVVFEIKYTHYWMDVEAMFYNSGQGLGYSIALDPIVGEEVTHYGVLYFICQDAKPKPQEIQFHVKEWEKTLKDRLKWFITLGLDVERIKRMRQLNHFPQRYQSCIRFNRICEQFGTCGLTTGEQERSQETDRYEYAFEFNLDDVIKNHLERTA